MTTEPLPSRYGRQFWTINDCLDVLKRQNVTRHDMAVAYAELLRDWNDQGRPEWDWFTLNDPIQNHWSLSGLSWIKKKAWQIRTTGML